MKPLYYIFDEFILFPSPLEFFNKPSLLQCNYLRSHILFYNHLIILKIIISFDLVHNLIYSYFQFIFILLKPKYLETHQTK